MGTNNKVKKKAIRRSTLLNEVEAIKKMHPKWGAQKMVHYLKDEKNISADIRDVEDLLAKGKKQDSRLSAALPSLKKECITKEECKKNNALYMGWFNW